MGLEKIIEERTGRKVVGFGSEPKDAHGKKMDNILKQVQPQDLIRYGLIPEFVGRLPVIATLEELSESALIRILTEPKNAIVKQYQKLLSYDSVKLKFSDTALTAIAKEAIRRKTGARGLRAILEDVMLDIMYEIPSQSNIKECLITEEVITKREKPLLIYEESA